MNSSWKLSVNSHHHHPHLPGGLGTISVIAKVGPLLFRTIRNFMSSYYWIVHEQLLKTVCQFSPPSPSSSWRQYHSKGAPLENQEAQKPRHSLLLFKTWWKKTNFSMAAQKSVNLQYNTLVRWFAGTYDSLIKHLMFQALLFLWFLILYT